MIKNLKYRLGEFIANRRVRIGGMALFLACTVAAVTLHGCPIHTADILATQKFFTLNKGLYSANTTLNKSEEVTFPVFITCGDQTVEISFSEGTVSDALFVAGFTADEDDFVEPSLNTVIKDTTYIDFAKVDYVTGSYKEAIAFDTEIVYSADKEKGYSAITKNGVNGEKEIFYTEKLVNGVSSEKNVTSSTVLSDPQDAVKVVGTKEKPLKTSESVKSISTLKAPFEIALDENGNPVNYKYKKTVRATAYSHTGNKCSTGVWPQPGHIAVNPKIIPYGTKLYIKSPDGSVIYGYAVAADTGGFIKRYPHGIDLFMSTESACKNFGVRNMEIYILE